MKILKALIGIIFVFYGILLGIIAAPYSVLGIAEVTHNAFVSYIGLIIMLLILVGVLTGIGNYLLFSEAKKGYRWAFWETLCVIVIDFAFLFYVFYAPTQTAPEYVGAPTNSYWDLSTGSRIAYAKFQGDSVTQQYPVVFLHGGAGAPVNHKEAFTDELTAMGYQVYQYDQWGCGNSSRAKNVEDYTCDRMVQDLEAIRQQIGAQKLILISHSWGGTLAASYMAEHPDCVAKSIFISPGNLWMGDSVEDLTEAGAADQSDNMSKCPRFLIAQMMVGAEFFQGTATMFPEKNLDNLYMEFHDYLNMRPGSDRFYNTKGSGFGFWANVITSYSNRNSACPYDKLKACTSQNLVIKGQYDYISWAGTELFRDQIPNTTMILVADMGHSVEKQYESEVWKNVKSFLETAQPVSAPFTGTENPYSAK